MSDPATPALTLRRGHEFHTLGDQFIVKGIKVGDHQADAGKAPDQFFVGWMLRRNAFEGQLGAAEIEQGEGAFRTAGFDRKAED